MAKVVRYKVRALNRKGKVVKKRTFKTESKALEWLRKKLPGRAQVRIKKVTVESFNVITDWGNTTTRSAAPKPVDTLVAHHSVTKHLSPNASVRQEKEQMRVIQSIGYARGLGGFPYGFAIFPSGRCYRGSGFGVIEAATGGYNTPTDSVVFPGNYEAFEPTKQALDTLEALGKWGQREDFLTKPLSLPPHQKFKQTACCGKLLIPKLPAVQKRINRKGKA